MPNHTGCSTRNNTHTSRTFEFLREMSATNNNNPPKKIDCPSPALADKSFFHLSSFIVKTFDPLIRQCYALSQMSV